MSENRIRPIKAYKNAAFLNSPSARMIRILSEMVEPDSRLRKYKVRNTVVFFGSSRFISRDKADSNLQEVRAKMAQQIPLEPHALEIAERDLRLSRYYEDAAELSERLTLWFKKLESEGIRAHICTGGGPGIMEAANLGSSRAKGRSVGFNISLPMEQWPNAFQTRELSFEFHYFFIRKFWFVYLAKALIVFPGGFGTFDELFELLTMIQTRKTTKSLPVVLYGSEYWNDVVHFDSMVKWGTISPEDRELFAVFDDVDQAYAYLEKELTEHFVKFERARNRKKG
ncbi:MAG: LOG family protein [Deltaproteobacteria bacterium]|nr:LOG family protein [Deltaproteobacteria bacterium]